MSSPTVRADILDAVTKAAMPVPVFAVSDYGNRVADIPKPDGGMFVLLDFVITGEAVASIAADGKHGWIEDGVASIHIVHPVTFDTKAALALGETLRMALRGSTTPSGVQIDSAIPFVDAELPAIGFKGGYHGWVSSAYFTYFNC